MSAFLLHLPRAATAELIRGPAPWAGLGGGARVGSRCVSGRLEVLRLRAAPRGLGLRNGGLRVLQPALGCRHPEEPPTPDGAAGRRPGIEALPALALRVGRRKGEVEGWLRWARCEGARAPGHSAVGDIG